MKLIFVLTLYLTICSVAAAEEQCHDHMGRVVDWWILHTTPGGGFHYESSADAAPGVAYTLPVSR